MYMKITTVNLRSLIKEELVESFGEPLIESERGDELEEVTPPGYEKVVRALKKDKNVDNPWAVAWSMKNKGIKP